MVTIWGSGMALCTEIAVAVPCCVSTTATKLVTLEKINATCPLISWLFAIHAPMFLKRDCNVMDL